MSIKSLLSNKNWVLVELTFRGSFIDCPEKVSWIIESFPIDFKLTKLIPVGFFVSSSKKPIEILFVLSDPSMHISSFSQLNIYAQISSH